MCETRLGRPESVGGKWLTAGVGGAGFHDAREAELAGAHINSSKCVSFPPDAGGQQRPARGGQKTARALMEAAAYFEAICGCGARLASFVSANGPIGLRAKEVWAQAFARLPGLRVPAKVRDGFKFEGKGSHERVLVCIRGC